MKKQLHKLLLLVAAVFFASSGYAYDAKIDGIYYNLNEADKTASVTHKGYTWNIYGDEVPYSDYTGNVIIPAAITYRGDTFSVTSIGDNAFYQCRGLTSVSIPSSVTSIGAVAFWICSGLTSVVIPSSVTSIGEMAFSDCIGLTSVTISEGVTSIGGGAFESCSGLTSVTIPSSVTSIEGGAFSGCSGLTSVTIPSSVTSIGASAFSGCSGLASVTIPSSVTSIGASAFSGCSGLTAINVSSDNPNYSSVDGVLYNKDRTHLYIWPAGKTGSVAIPSFVTSIGQRAFYGCSGLTSVTIPSSVTRIDDDAFSGCSALTSVTISEGVTSIGGGAFESCSGLTSVTIPFSVEYIGWYAFNGCSLATLYFFTTGVNLSSCLESLTANPIIYAHSTDINAIKRYWNGTVRDIDSPYVDIVSYTASLGSISFYFEMNEYATTLQSIKLGETELTPDENHLCVMTNLEPDTPYDITITYLSPDGEENSYTQSICTKKPEVNISIRQSTQTTMNLIVSAESDTTSSADKKGFICNDRDYYCTGDTLVLRGLNPKTKYDIVPFAEYGTKRITGNSSSFWTESLNLTIAPLVIGPTSISVEGDYVAGDARISNTGFTDHNSGDILALNGLLPNTSYTVEYYVRTEGGGYETVSQTFTTAALELTTLQPRCVSSTCAIVAAETNIVEEETNVGFQWKKYDAPSSLKPNEGYAAIYGGQLEGYVRNLQPTSYYNVRAFYKSAEGKYCYGNWVTFDPSDFSYFEPTVHTYAATGVTHGSARVRGYVLAGTDDIEEQGFEYWPISDSEVNARRVKAAVTNAADDVQTVLATGQVMTAELRDLRPGTTYCCRAFVKTATRTTYGETQTFTTEGDPTGIDDITIDTPAAMPTVTGYYDLSGRKSDTPHHGVNIVRYSDGAARKVIMK